MYEELAIYCVFFMTEVSFLEVRPLENVIPCIKCNTGNLPDAAVLQFKSTVSDPHSFRVNMEFTIKATKETKDAKNVVHRTGNCDSC